MQAQQRVNNKPPTGYEQRKKFLTMVAVVVVVESMIQYGSSRYFVW